MCQNTDGLYSVQYSTVEAAAIKRQISKDPFGIMNTMSRLGCFFGNNSSSSRTGKFLNPQLPVGSSSASNIISFLEGSALAV